ncbi:MAG: ABC transporter permease [Chloroflexota bacterium]|nr:ABC transporter permease [Chloroflexota bacterium]
METNQTELPKSGLHVGEFDSDRSSIVQRFLDLWRYRELVYRLTAKNLKLRYKSSFLGFLWSLINPLLMMLVYYLVFNVLLATPVSPNCSEVSIGPDDTRAALHCKIYNHYTAYILIGILPWNFTASSVVEGLMAVLGNASIIKKVYFPREVLAISNVLGLFINFLLALIILFAVIFLNNVQLTPFALLLPLLLLFHLLFMLGVALFLSALVIYFRDLAVIMEVLITAWFFLTPILYTMEDVYKEWNGISTAAVMYWINPMASFIQTYRQILFYGVNPEFFFTLRTCLTGLVTFILGYIFFIKTTRSIGERL